MAVKRIVTDIPATQVDAARVFYPADTVLTIALPGFLAGSRDFTALWRPDARRALQGVFWSAGRLVVHALDDLRPTYTVCEPGPEGWMTRLLLGLPTLGGAGV